MLRTCSRAVVLLGPVDASWLVLERLPYTHDPGWGAAAFSSLLAAAARFQVFAAAVDTNLVFDEDVETIRRFALGGQDLGPEAATVVSHLDGDWAWVEAVAPREVLFGDLHFGNAAFRRPPPDPATVLFDPIPRRQPWPFEAAYLEVLCNGSGLVREMAAIRRAQGQARPASGMTSTGCRRCFAGGSHSHSGPCSRTGILIPPSGRGWPSTCRPPRISTGYGTMLLRNCALI